MFDTVLWVLHNVRVTIVESLVSLHFTLLFLIDMKLIVQSCTSSGRFRLEEVSVSVGSTELNVQPALDPFIFTA